MSVRQGSEETSKVEYREFAWAPGEFYPYVSLPVWEPFCVYQLLWQGQVIYVGQTTALESRIAAHLRHKQVDQVTVISCRTADDMRKLEAELIHELHPPLNRVCPGCHKALPAAACNRRVFRPEPDIPQPREYTWAEALAEYRAGRRA